MQEDGGRNPASERAEGKVSYMEGNNILCPSPSLPERLKNTSLVYFGYLQFERGNFSKFERNYNIELKKYTMKLEKSMEVIQQMLTMVHVY